MVDLTREEKAQAATQGWGLYHVYDAVSCRWHLGVLPTEFTASKGAAQALQHVVSMAKTNNQLCIKALRLMAQFNMRKKR